MLGNCYSVRAQESPPRLVPDDSSDEGHEEVVDEPEYPLTSTDLEPVAKTTAMSQLPSDNVRDQTARIPAPPIIMVEGQLMSSHASNLPQAAVMPANPMIMIGDRVVLPHTSGLPRDSTASSDPDGDKLDDGDELGDDDDEDEDLPEPDDPISLEDLLYYYGTSPADKNVKVKLVRPFLPFPFCFDISTKRLGPAGTLTRALYIVAIRQAPQRHDPRARAPCPAGGVPFWPSRRTELQLQNNARERRRRHGNAGGGLGQVAEARGAAHVPASRLPPRLRHLDTAEKGRPGETLHRAGRLGPRAASKGPGSRPAQEGRHQAGAA